MGQASDAGRIHGNLRPREFARPSSLIRTMSPPSAASHSSKADGVDRRKESGRSACEVVVCDSPTSPCPIWKNTSLAMTRMSMFAISGSRRMSGGAPVISGAAPTSSAAYRTSFPSVESQDIPDSCFTRHGGHHHSAGRRRVLTLAGVTCPSCHHRRHRRRPSSSQGRLGLRRGPLSWVYELVARYRAEGDAALEPRSRRPHTSPRATLGRTAPS